MASTAAELTNPACHSALLSSLPSENFLTINDGRCSGVALSDKHGNRGHAHRQRRRPTKEACPVSYGETTHLISSSSNKHHSDHDGHRHDAVDHGAPNQPPHRI